MKGVPPIPPSNDFRGGIALVTGGTDGPGRHLTATLVSLSSDGFSCGKPARLAKCRGTGLLRLSGSYSDSHGQQASLATAG